jgi:hypothetical protein
MIVVDVTEIACELKIERNLDKGIESPSGPWANLLVE